MAYSSSTIFVTFDCLPEEEIWTLLDSHNLHGTKIPGVIQRYAIEVPYGHEERFKEIFGKKDVVRSVSQSTLRGMVREVRNRAEVTKDPKKKNG